MSGPGEHPERTPNELIEHLTFAEAGDRLGISADAARMRANRGTLTTVEVAGHRVVPWPQPATEHPNEPRTERTGSTNRSPVQPDVRLITALEDRIESLERQLTERAEEIRRRDHLIAGLIERLPETLELPAATTSSGEQPANRGSVPQRSTGWWDRLRRRLGG